MYWMQRVLEYSLTPSSYLVGLVIMILIMQSVLQYLVMCSGGYCAMCLVWSLNLKVGVTFKKYCFHVILFRC